MREKTTKKWKGFLWVVCVLFALTLTGKVQAAAATVTMTIERFATGGNFIMEPTIVEFTPGETYADVFQRVLKQKGLSYSYRDTSMGFYLEGIDKVDAGIENMPSCVREILNDQKISISGNRHPGGLYECSYTSRSGWLYYVNNQNVLGMSVVKPKQGDVARLMFTLCYGTDLTGELLASGSNKVIKTYYPVADKTELVRLMGTINEKRDVYENADGFSDAWSEALDTMAKMNASSYEVMETVNYLQEIIDDAKEPTPTPTPVRVLGKTSISKVSSASYSSLKITWKKAANASGYVVYRATSSKGSYKAIKTIQGGSVLSYTNGSLATGKTYYYKVRPFQTVNGVRKYGSYSSYKSGKPVLASTTLTVKAGKNQAALKWKKVSGASGYQIYRATSKNGKYTLVTTIKKGSTVAYTNKKLTAGKTYYYKVRAYRTVNGKNIYGSYSAIKTVKAAGVKK